MSSAVSHSAPLLSVKSLLAANCHFGHETMAWNRKMLPFIYGARNGIHIINLEHTLTALRRAIRVTKSVAFNQGKIVFVGTKPAIHATTVAAALDSSSYFVNKWIGGRAKTELE